MDFLSLVSQLRAHFIHKDDVGQKLGLLGVFRYVDAAASLTDQLMHSAVMMGEQSIPYFVWADTTSNATPYFADENATPRTVVYFVVPQNYAGGAITVRTLWNMVGTGLVDTELFVDWTPLDTDDAAITVVTAAWANTPTQPNAAIAGRSDTVTVTIAATDLAAGRAFRVAFRRNTGDANASNVLLLGVDVRATLRTYDDTPLVLPRAGKIVALSAASTEARAAGSATLKAAINGAVSATPSVVLDGTNPQYVRSADSYVTFAAGDRLTGTFTTTADWLPVTADLTLCVWGEMP